MRRVIGARRGATRSIRTESFSMATATKRSYGTLTRSSINVTLVSSNALDKAGPLSSSTTWATQRRWAATASSSSSVASASEKSEASASTTAGDSEETTFIAALRHVIAELPQHGLRLVDLDERIRAVLGDSKKANPTRYGYSSIIDALAVVNETHYIADEMIMPCDWEKVITNVRNKLPSGGVLEPAFVRYINAEGCPNFRRGGGATSSAVNTTTTKEGDDAQQHADYAGETPKQRAARAIRESLKAENPSGSSLPGVTLSDWVQTHFSRLVEVVDVTPHAVLARAAAQGVTNPVRTYMYKPIPEVHPYVNVLYSAFKCLGCPDPHHTPVAVPLTDVAAIVPLLPHNPKTSASYTWSEFLQVPEVAESFDTHVSVYVAEKKKAQTQVIFVDGTTLEPDEAEAAVHQWRARRKREVGADTQVNIHVVVVRREDDAPHTIYDVIVDGYVVEPAQAIVARLALISDTQSLDPVVYENIGGHGGAKNNNNNLSSSSGSRNSENSAFSSSSSSSTTEGWSAVSDATNKADFSSSSSKPSSSSGGVSKALSFIPNYEDEIEVSIAAQLGGSTSPSSHTGGDSGSFLKSLADGERDNAAEVSSSEEDDTPSSATSSSSSHTTALTSLSNSSLVKPLMPTANVSPDVVILVGSRDAKEAIDAEMTEVNAGRHWVRTLLVVGDV